MDNPTWEQQLIANTLKEQLVLQKKERRWKMFTRLVFLIIVGMVILSFFSQQKTGTIHKDHVALVNLEGMIGPEHTNADEIAAGLREAFENDNAKALILRINSPGGAPVQSAYIYDEIVRLKQTRPDFKVYAVIADIGASGAYYVAAAADEIYANASSLVGSIGVVMRNFGFVDAMQKVGVQQRSLSAGDNKLMLDPFSPEDPKQTQLAQDLLDNVHKHFIQAVQDGRKDKLVNQGDLFSGRIWTGEQALKVGLVDGLKSPGQVARDIVKIEDVVDYSVKDNLLERIATKIGSSFSKGISSAFEQKMY